jgi:hypothetical protein
MCLINVTTTEPLIAEEDITVYKFIEKCFNNWKELVNHGDECIAVINNETVNGKISIDSSDELFICNSKISGCFSEDMLGYKYSWIFDNNVTSIIVKNKEIIKEISKEGYRTIYQKAKVVIGETYKSKLILDIQSQINKPTVDIGLHSYIKKPSLKLECILVECVIPKGSNYFIGDFDEIKDSIASDTLKYIKIIN